MSEVIQITSVAEFKDILDSERDVVICFSARDWCAPCRALEPHYAAAAVQSDITFVDINIEEFPEIAKEWNVYSVPKIFRWEAGVVTNIQGRTAVKIIGELE